MLVPLQGRLMRLLLQLLTYPSLQRRYLVCLQLPLLYRKFVLLRLLLEVSFHLQDFLLIYSNVLFIINGCLASLLSDKLLFVMGVIVVLRGGP